MPRKSTDAQWGDQALVLGIARLLATAPDFRDALHEVIFRLTEALGMDRGSILLVGDTPNTLLVVATSESRTFSRIAVQLDRYPEVRTVLDTGQPLVLEDAQKHPVMHEVSQLLASAGVGSLVLFPLQLDGQPRGAFLLRSATVHPGLPPSAVTLGRLIASLLSLALHNPRLREAVREQTRRISLESIEAARRQRAQERFRDFFETASDGTIVLGEDGAILYMNRSAEEITGYSREGLLGRRFRDIVAEEHREAVAGILAQVAAGSTIGNFDVDLITTSNDRIIVSVSTSLQKSDEPMILLGFRDVTDARTLEDELRKTRDFLAHLIDAAIDAIVAADMNGTILLFNKGAERIYGYAAEEAVGRMNVEALYPPGGARQVMRELRSPQFGGAGRLEQSRKDIVTRDGESVPVNLTASIMYEDGREIATVGVFSDLRERLRIEQRLHQAQEKLVLTEKQAVIAELAGATAHELNQPLTSILGYAAMMKKRMAPDDLNRRAVETILSEAERMADVVRKIGQITKYETKSYTGSQRIIDLDKASGKQG